MASATREGPALCKQDAHSETAQGTAGVETDGGLCVLYKSQSFLCGAVLRYPVALADFNAASLLCRLPQRRLHMDLGMYRVLALLVPDTREL